MTTETNSLVSKTACLLITFRRPGIKRRLTNDQYEVDSDRTLVGASKKILDSPEYGQVCAHERGIKAWLESQSLPSKLYRDSTFLIPITKMAAVDAFVEKAAAEREEHVAAFMSTYQARKVETMARLSGVGDDGDYLGESAMRDAFGFEHSWVSLSTPSTLKEVSAALYEREEQRLKERLVSAEADIIATFRLEFLGMVQNMKSMLDGSGDVEGKSKRFLTDKRIERLQTYVSEFSQKDVFGDDELSKLMGDASKMLQGVNPKELKDDAAWRSTMATSFGDIAAKLETLTKVRGKRLIEEEEEVGA